MSIDGHILFFEKPRFVYCLLERKSQCKCLCRKLHVQGKGVHREMQSDGTWLKLSDLPD